MALRDSAIALVWRPGAESGLELLWLRRGKALRFGAGFYAFPGGKLDPEDAAVPVIGASGEAATFRVCAVRECFEETGLLLLRGATRLTPLAREALRQELAGGMAFATLLVREGLTLHAADLVEAGRWVTPSFMPVRFDARMFLARAPAGQAVSLSALEASEGGFIAPKAALARWNAGSALLHPPNWNALVALAEVTQADDAGAWSRALTRLREPPLVRDFITHLIEFERGIVLVPQRTPTLPPATHTNAYLLGTEEMVLVDPGADDPVELAALNEVIAALEAQGRKLVAIALTHHHIDHIGGVQSLRAARGLPIWAHPLAASPLSAAGLTIDRTLADNEPLGLRGYAVDALHTPGHTRGHLSFWHAPSGAAIVGDLISGVSTVVIDPPEGNMRDYFASLERLLALDVATLYPAHGAAITDAPGKLAETLAHRRDRECKVRDAVAGGAGTPEEIVPLIYQGTPPALFPLAERSVQAHLDKLDAEGVVIVSGGRYRLSPPAG